MATFQTLRENRKNNLGSSEYTGLSRMEFNGHNKEEHPGQDNEKVFQCNKCSWTSNNISRLRDHIKRVHLGMKRHVCEYCNKKFLRPSLLKKHMIKMHGAMADIESSLKRIYVTVKRSLFKCYVCEYICHSKEQLKVHDREVHNYQNGQERVTTFNCDKCSYSCENVCKLRDHIKVVHFNKKSHVCKYCSQIFWQPKQLKIHLNSKHPATWFSTMINSNQCKNKDSGSIGCKCKNCNLMADSKKELNSHADFECSQFDEDFIDESKLHKKTENLEEIHKNIETINEDANTNKDDQKSSECDLSCYKCEAVFDNESSLNIHMKNVHDMLECPKCSELFELPTDLKKHLEIVHETKSEFQCKICGLACHNLAFFLHHVKSHNKQNHVKCPICEKKFFLEKYMQIHMKKEHQRQEIYESDDVKLAEECSEQDNDIDDKEVSAELMNNEMLHIYDSISDNDSINDNEEEIDEVTKQIIGDHENKNKFVGHRYQCIFCDSSFSTKSLMDLHVQSNHYRAMDSKSLENQSCLEDEENDYCKNIECNLCSALFKSENSLNEHMLKYHLAECKKCNLCNYSTHWKAYFKAHMRERHKLTDRYIDSYAKSDYQIKDCSVKLKRINFFAYNVSSGIFATRNDLKTHLATKHNHAEEDIVREADIMDNDMEFSCDTGENVKNAYSDSDYEPYDKVYGEEDFLEENVKAKERNNDYIRQKTNAVHEKDKIVCKHCNELFSKRYLKYHVKSVHFGIKDFQCEQCDCRYTQKNRLRRHVKIKHEEPRFKCDVCNKLFAEKRTLQSHVRRCIAH